MLRTLRPRHISGALLAYALLRPLSAAAADDETQAWLTESVVIRASAADTIGIDSSQRFRSGRANGEQQTVRVLLDHGVAPGLLIGGGLAYFRSAAEQELRFFEQATFTRGVFLARARLEQRYFDTAERPGWRLRQRLQAAIPLGSRKAPTLIAATEFFFQLNRARPSDKTGLATMRQQIGLRQPLSKALDLQFLYMRQQTFRDRRPDTVSHIPWATLTWKI
ncbi:DUF2490 domain-containing protein [Sphingobium bisphenolivorans]|uniref:DUF2490 domain-containing protein n=1 Tax=Sphingobium bisphenolivorans TaxID=1335760 RepID=UPI0003A89E26|nr:DUF2490 domain-containing protein [Sphingobium bisphenolivorans]